jgi:hypothetical protein
MMLLMFSHQTSLVPVDTKKTRSPAFSHLKTGYVNEYRQK